MKTCIIKSVSIFLSLLLLNACSVSDITDMLSDESAEEEIVIREIPDSSFDPEEMEEVIIDNASKDEVEETISEITIVDNEENFNTEETIDTILDENELQGNDLDQKIENTNGRGQPVFTYVGQRLLEMRDEFNKLDNEISEKKISFDLLKSNGIKSAENYHSIVAAIAARLQIGTTPGNPILLDQFENAQTELSSVSAQGQNIVDVGNKISLLSTRVSYLLEQARAAKKLRGAVDQDHRDLSAFQDALKRRSVDVMRSLEELNETVRRREIFLAAERRRLTLLANAISVGESFGTGLGTVKSLPVSNKNNSYDQKSQSSVSPSPIAIFKIRSESENYHQDLFGAVSAALEKAPETKFTLVAVSSSAGNASKQAERAANAKLDVGKIISSLVSMGMPVDRLSVNSISVASVENTEVRLYAD
ncbi:hypothetical protein N9R86_02810 [Alphaproteobacteria bacterium]|nr:hypothetical protein [Alphaproteobacteria bacterium]